MNYIWLTSNVIQGRNTMWLYLNNLLSKFIVRISKHDSKETWVLLEMRQNANLENLEDLKKLRIKNF